MYDKEIKLSVDKTLGYTYFIDKEHPLATGNSNRVYYHRHAMSLHLGRWISREEVVHHINHDKSDNRIDNLEILSMAEHTAMHNPKLPGYLCQQCGKEYQPPKSVSKFCSTECKTISSRKIGRDLYTIEEIEELIWTLGFTKAGNKLGISDNGIKKMAKNMNCLMPPPYFINKVKPENRLEAYKEAKKHLKA